MRKYTKEFKESAVDLIINGNNKVIDIARDLDVHHKTLHAWVTNYKKEHNLPIRNVNNSNKLSICEQDVKRKC